MVVWVKRGNVGADHGGWFLLLPPSDISGEPSPAGGALKAIQEVEVACGPELSRTGLRKQNSFTRA